MTLFWGNLKVFASSHYVYVIIVVYYVILFTIEWCYTNYLRALFLFSKTIL